MEILNFVGIALVGSAISLILEGIKRYFGSNTFASRASIIVLAIVAGLIYYLCSDTQWWISITGILAAASTFYSFFLAKKPSTG